MVQKLKVQREKEACQKDASQCKLPLMGGAPPGDNRRQGIPFIPGVPFLPSITDLIGLVQNGIGGALGGGDQNNNGNMTTTTTVAPGPDYDYEPLIDPGPFRR